MGRISLWNPVKGADYLFVDQTIGENFRISGDAVLVHMYEGPTTNAAGNINTDLTTIQDVLFLTNANRRYNPNVIELRGHHEPQDVTYDLSQFGVFLSSDVIRITFHYNDMLDSMGRKLIAGDVLEFPSMRDVPIFDNAVGINRYYVVQDALYAAKGYGQKWFPHIWLVRAKQMTSSPEFSEIIDQAGTGQTAGGVGQGIGIMPPGFTEISGPGGNPGLGCDPNIRNSLDLFCQIIKITDEIVAEAQRNAFFDPKFFESANLYIYIDPNTGYPIIGSNYFSGDGAPPNLSTDNRDNLVPSGPLVGAGVSFPTDMQDGQYYLRLDYYPERLFQKQGVCFKLIEVNVLKIWTAYNRVLDTFIDNNKDTILSDGTIIPEKQAISQVVKQKVDLYAERKIKVLADEAVREAEANRRAALRGNSSNEGSPGTTLPGTPIPGAGPPIINPNSPFNDVLNPNTIVSRTTTTTTSVNPNPTVDPNSTVTTTTVNPNSTVTTSTVRTISTPITVNTNIPFTDLINPSDPFNANKSSNK